MHSDHYIEWSFDSDKNSDELWSSNYFDPF